MNVEGLYRADHTVCFRHPKALVSTMPALIAFWNIGMCIWEH